MTGKLTPPQLRAKAKDLLEQAAAEEARRQQLIGKMVVGLTEKGFEGFDLELFKTQVKEIWTSGKIKKKPKTKSAKTTLTTDSKEQKRVA